MGRESTENAPPTYRAQREPSLCASGGSLSDVAAMHSSVNDLLDWLQNDRSADQSEAKELIEVLEDLQDQVCAADFGGDSVVDIDLRSLREAAQSDDQQIRKIATLAMARFGDPTSQLDVNELLADDCPTVRQAAVETAGALQQADSASALINLLYSNEEEPQVRRAVALALGRIRDPGPAVLESLIHTVTDPDADVRKFVIKALAGLGALNGTSPVDALCVALCDEVPEIRGQAAEALGRLGDASACDALSLALADSSRSARGKAAIALAGLKDDRALPVLTELLNEGGAFKLEAARAIGALARPAGIDALLGLLKDKDARVRCAAVESLHAISEPRVLGILRDRAEKEPDESVLGALEAAISGLESQLPQESQPSHQEPQAGAPPVHAPQSDLDILEAIKQAASKLICTVEESDAEFLLTVSVPGGRSQDVMVSVADKDEDGEQIIRVTSVCGPADSGNYLNALLLNQHLVFGAISVKRELAGQTFELSEAILARDITVESLRDIISYIASTAGQVASQLAGD